MVVDGGGRVEPCRRCLGDDTGPSSPEGHRRHAPSAPPRDQTSTSADPYGRGRGPRLEHHYEVAGGKRTWCVTCVLDPRRTRVASHEIRSKGHYSASTLVRSGMRAPVDHAAAETRRTSWTDCASARSWPPSTPRGQPDARAAARPRAGRAPRPARLRRGVDRRAPLGRHRDHRLAGDLHRGGGGAHQADQARHRGDLDRYHNPLWVAERMVLLDHLTRGRAMLGCGPGSLPSDSMMLGLNPTDTRELLEVNLDIIMRLLPARASPSRPRPTTSSTPSCSCGPTPSRASTWPSPPWPPRPGRGWPAGTAPGCSRSAQP